MATRNVDGIQNLWKYEIKDETYTQVTFGEGNDTTPMPDPGGKGIYFVTGKPAGSLLSYDVKTQMNREISEDLASQPIISTDGKKMIYIRYVQPGKIEELWVSDIDGKNKRKVFSSSTLFTGTWSPDSQHFTFWDRPKEDHPYIVGVDGRGLRAVPPISELLGLTAWSPDGKEVYYATGTASSPLGNVWKSAADGAGFSKIMNNICSISDVTPDGKYLLCNIGTGDEVGIYEVSISDKKRIPLLPGVETFYLTMSADGTAIQYPIAGKNEITVYRVNWKDGKLTGEPRPVFKPPFNFPFFFFGNAYDISRDLSAIAYARPRSRADLYLLAYQ